MANVGLAYRNRAVSGLTSAGGTWSATYPRANVLDPLVKKVARTSAVTMAATRLRLDLGAIRHLRAFGVKEHNLSPHARWRLRAGLSEYDIDFTSGVKDDRLTFGGGANGSIIDSSGAIVAASAGRFTHDPGDVVNGTLWSDDIASGTWFPLAGSDASIVDFETIALGVGGAVYCLGGGCMPSTVYTVSAEVQLVSGDGSFQFYANDGVSNFPDATTKTATSEWQEFSFSFTSGATAGTLAAGALNVYSDHRFLKTGAAGVLKVRRVMFNKGVLPVDTAGNRVYRKTTGARLYRCIGLLQEPARIQLLDSTGVIQNGTGSWVKDVNLTANGASGTLLGLAAYSFTSTATSNSFIYQAETVSISTTYSAAFLSDTNAGGTSVVQADDGAGGSVTNHAFVYRLIAPGVYLATVAFTTTASQTRAVVFVGRINAPAATTFRVSAPLLEAGTSRTSHIINAGGSGTTVTRSVDTCVSAALTAYSKGTLYAESVILDPATGVGTETQNYVATLRDAGTSYVAVRALRTPSVPRLGADALVYNSGSPTHGSAVSVMTAGTVCRQAVSFTSGDIRSYIDGTLALSNTGTIDSDMTVLDLGLLNQHTTILGRVILGRHMLTNDQLDALTTSGPADYDSGWVQAMQIAMKGDIPSDWGKRGYDLIACASAHAPARYLTLEIDDTGNAAGYIELGRLFAGQMLQPSLLNPEYGQWKRGRRDRSSHAETPSGVDFSTSRRRTKWTSLTFPLLTPDEAGEVAELQDFCGTTEEVLYLPDPADMAKCQRDGGLCLIEELDELDYPMHEKESAGFKLKEKV